MFAEDYMTPNPHTIAPSAALIRAADLMKSHRVRHLPVVDSNCRLVGVLSDRDVRSAIGYDRKLGAELTVSEVMTADPTTIEAKTSLDEALRVFCTNRYGSLPVLRSNDLVGILTRSDLLWAFYGLMGLDEAGRRIDVALPNGWADLASAFGALSDHRPHLISAIVSRTRRDGDEPSLYLRVGGEDARQAERHLRDAAMIVLEPEHP
jgi:acetoin utilization protein AcuB